MVRDSDDWKQRIYHDSSPGEKLISLEEGRKSLSRQKDQTIADHVVYTRDSLIFAGLLMPFITNDALPRRPNPSRVRFGLRAREKREERLHSQAPQLRRMS